jgi:hypothetical protein
MTIVTFNSIAGATVYYPSNGLKPRTCRLEEKFHAKIEAMFADLWQRSPWGQAQWIGSLGCMVPSTPGHDSGRHDTGEAFDLATVQWAATNWARVISATDPRCVEPEVPAAGSVEAVARCLAVEAVVRLHFQTALNWWFNAAHRDHWHIDTGRGEPTWEARGNQVRFLQAALRYVWGAEGLVIDGQFGPKTERALMVSDWAMKRTSFVALAPGAAWWPAFLEETAEKGFAL